MGSRQGNLQIDTVYDMKNTDPAVLPGGISVYQDPGAPVSTDTLLLASSLSVPPGSVIVDLGCGSGGASLYSSSLNPGCRWIGIDIRHDPLKLLIAAAAAGGNQCDIAAVCCGIETVPLIFSKCIADAVILNPPFGNLGSVRTSPNRARDQARAGSRLLLHQFLRGAAHLLVPGGELLIINKPSSLPEILLGCRAFGINPEEIQPIGLVEKPAERIILRGRKGSGKPLSILPFRT